MVLFAVNDLFYAILSRFCFSLFHQQIWLIAIPVHPFIVFPFRLECKVLILLMYFINSAYSIFVARRNFDLECISFFFTLFFLLIEMDQFFSESKCLIILGVLFICLNVDVLFVDFLLMLIHSFSLFFFFLFNFCQILPDFLIPLT